MARGMKIFLHLSWTDADVFADCHHCCTIKDAWESCGVYSQGTIGTYLITTQIGTSVILYPQNITNGSFVSKYPVKGECIIIVYGDDEGHLEICVKDLKCSKIECLNEKNVEIESDFVKKCNTCKNEHDDDSVCTQCEGKGGRRWLGKKYNRKCKIFVDESPTQIHHYNPSPKREISIPNLPQNRKKKVTPTFLDTSLWLGDGFCNVCNEYHGKLSQQCNAWCPGDYFLEYCVTRDEALQHFKSCCKFDHSSCKIYTKVLT